MEAITAEQIRQEFDDTSNQITTDIISKTETQLLELGAKAERFKDLGFRNAAPVKNFQLIKGAKKSIKRYSGYKFITEEAIKAICDKYGLLFGTTDRYLGDIPEKNLKEIEAFKEYDDKKQKSKKEKIEKSDLIDALALFDKNLRIPRSMPRSLHVSMMDYPIPAPFVDPNIYMIAAPINLMKHKKSELVDGYKIVDDPIVFKKVKGGYLIISSWGKEAYDERVINPSHN